MKGGATPGQKWLNSLPEWDDQNGVLVVAEMTVQGLTNPLMWVLNSNLSVSGSGSGKIWTFNERRSRFEESVLPQASISAFIAEVISTAGLGEQLGNAEGRHTETSPSMENVELKIVEA